MERVKRLAIVGLAGAIMVMFGAGAVEAVLPTKGQRCEAAKVTAAGAKQRCLATERAREVKGQMFNYAKCDAAFVKAFANAEDNAGVGVCPTEGDAAAIETMIDACFDDLKGALSGSPNPPCVPRAFPATGQTTCWDHMGNVVSCAGTGQDGDIQAGATLSYTDNGDGTITDNNTGLMWEKKSLEGDISTNIHHRDKAYTWTDAVAQHIANLNAGAGFAGHTDWRLPNVKELQSIVNYENTSPAVSPAFDTGCAAGCTVLTCSCTSAGNTWSSSTEATLGTQTKAWLVDFISGFVITDFKGGNLAVRAVRDGS